MGCVSSTESREEARAKAMANAKVQQQRRRLSLAPDHVGDITESYQPTNASPARVNMYGNLSEAEELAKGNLTVAVVTKKGVVPYNRDKVNQDRPIVKYGLNGDSDINLFGVMDGHGEFGHDVASLVQSRLPFALESQEGRLKGDTAAAMTDSVAMVVRELESSGINTAFSGTTAVFGVVSQNKLYSANIGDSRCVMCRQANSGAVQCIALSFDQKPDDPKEKERILKAGGRVAPLPGPPNEDCGPQRVWLADVNVPGLAMSRSIGDEVSQSVGVISVPEIIEHELQDNDIFAIWASDGVWEFITNEEAVKLVWKYKHDLHMAADKLLVESVARWEREEAVVDDITIVIVGFNQAK